MTISDEKPAWLRYELVALHVLRDIREHLGIATVEEKQSLDGLRSGTSYVVDGKAIREGDGGFLIIECKRWPDYRLRQDDVGGLAYRIIDTGAAGGITISPLSLQTGAQKVASAENIQHVQIDPRSTETGYLAKFLDTAFVGLHATIGPMLASVAMTVLRSAPQASAHGADECGVEAPIVSDTCRCCTCGSTLTFPQPVPNHAPCAKCGGIAFETGKSAVT